MKYDEKKTFVGIHLFHIVTALNSDVISVIYENAYTNEFVVLDYCSGLKRRINITGDSNLAITKKVLKVIEDEVKNNAGSL